MSCDGVIYDTPMVILTQTVMMDTTCGKIESIESHENITSTHG